MALSLIQRSQPNFSLRRFIPLASSVCFIASLSVAQPQSTGETPQRFRQLLQQGFKLHRQREYRRAIPILERARAIQPDNYSVNLLLGMDYLRSGDPEKAVGYLNAARTSELEDGTATGYLGEAYAALQRFGDAVQVLQAAVANPKATAQSRAALVQFYLRRFRQVMLELRVSRLGLAYSYRLQARVLRARGDGKEKEMLHRVQSFSPDFPGLESALGFVHLRQGELKEAASRFAKARELNPNDLDAWVGKAMLAVRAGDLEPGKELFREVARRSPHRLVTAVRDWPSTVGLPSRLRDWLAVRKPATPHEISLSPQSLFQEQRWEALIDRLGSGEPTSREWLWLGIAHAQLEQFGRAIPPLERARSDVTLQLEAAHWLALSYARAEEEEVRRLPQEGREAALVHLAKGEIFFLLSRDGVAAVAEYQKAVDADPRNPTAWAGLAAAQMMSGNSKEARLSAQKALHLDPGRLAALRTYAEAAMQERDHASAIPALRRVREVMPNDLVTRILLGTAYSQTGQYAEALPLLQAVLDQEYPDEKGTIHYLLGTVLRRLGRREEANQALQQAQQLSDSFARAGHRVGKDSP